MSEETPVSSETTETSNEVQTLETPVFDVLIDQGLTAISEDDLRGETAEEKDVEGKEEGTAEGKTDQEVEVKPEVTEDTETTPPPKVEPPPKGYVPLAALKESREETRALKDRIKALEAKVLTPEVKTPAEVVPEVRTDFKVLTTAEFRELSDESPRDALVYMAELRDYENVQRISQAREQEVDAIFRESVKLMEEAVPTLFDEDSEAPKILAEFAETVGFTKDMFYLTNPETQIILPGETKPVYLGTQAASILKMLAGLQGKIVKDPKSAVDETALRKSIEAEVLKKIKTGGKSFKSLSDIPTSDSETPASKGVLSEAQYMKLTPAQQKAYLSGE